MTFINTVRKWLYEPSVQGQDVDNPAFLETHARILKDKKLLNSTFKTFYVDMIAASDKYFSADGLEIELGAGTSFFKEFRPHLKTSDIRTAPNIDLTLDAQKMDLPDASVRCFYAINVFHHLSKPDLFFKELIRTLQKSGGCILIEPHNGFASAMLHRHLHTDEYFDPKADRWDNDQIAGPLSNANQALSHIVFERDIDLWNQKYGDSLEIVHKAYCLNALRYLFSGGLNFRQLVPSLFLPLLKFKETLGKPIAKHWTLHQMIVIQRK